MRLEDLTAAISLNGLEPSAVATIVAVVPIAEGAVQVIYKTPGGSLKDRLLNRADEPNISPPLSQSGISARAGQPEDWIRP
jgi:hypothetical protein